MPKGHFEINWPLKNWTILKFARESLSASYHRLTIVNFGSLACQKIVLPTKFGMKCQNWPTALPPCPFTIPTRTRPSTYSSHVFTNSEMRFWWKEKKTVIGILCQKHLFWHQLTHSLTKDWSLNYEFSTWNYKLSKYILCTQIVLNVKTKNN